MFISRRMFVKCALQDLQKQKESKEEELLELQKVANERKSKVDTVFRCFLSLYIVLIDVLIYSAAQLQDCLINILNYLLTHIA